MPEDKKFFEKGIQWQCQGSGKCCVSRGETGSVYLTRDDLVRLANHHNMTVTGFISLFCREEDDQFVIEDLNQPQCRFLCGTRCTVYEARPTQCRTWPFWPENMSARGWKENVATFCPGVGKGPVVTAEQIEVQLQLQEEADSK